MATPSSNKRASVDSELSTSSSHSHKPGEPGTSVGSSSPLSRDSIKEQDFARRKERVRRSGGFLLDDSLPWSSLNNESIQFGKTRRSAQATERTTQDPAPSPGPASQQSAIDPNQLVHMALNLSESRRRNLNASQLLAPHPRTASGLHRDGSFSGYGAGSSLRHYLDEQRRASRNVSPMGSSGSTPLHRSGSLAYPTPQSLNPSPATLARVEKARAYIELRIEYLRLLQFLPPLKPDANAPGNFTFASTNVPGSPHAQLTRTPSYANKQHHLGRAYNPLQFIRNRRSRARERRTLDHASLEFAQVDDVREWVDRVEQHATRPGYRGDDVVQLPKIHEDHAIVPESTHPVRPHKGWIFTSEELLADAHWLEQGDNKMLLENRHGHRIFPPRETKQQDHHQPRASKEISDKQRRSWADDGPGGHGTGDESDKASQRGRKRKLLTVLRADSPRGGKHSRRNSRLRNKDDSDSAGSDTDSGKRSSNLPGDSDQNTGPLALLLEQQAKQAEMKSAAIHSPDTPDKWGRETTENTTARHSLDIPWTGSGTADGHTHGNVKARPKPRRIPTLSIDDTEPRSSLEEWDSTAPNTPLYPKSFPPFGADMSPPPSRAGSEHKRSRRSKLSIFNSQDHGIDTKSEARPEKTGIDRHGRSRQTSDETHEEKHMGTSILTAPGAVRNLLTHRKNDSVSSLTSPEKPRRRETAEPHSAVTRFFKGAKQGGSKVGELIFRRDRADESEAETLSDRGSLDLDTDTSAMARRHKRPPVSRVVTAGTTSSVISDKYDRSRLDLPSFRPVNESRLKDENGSEAEHPISKQTREQKNSRSPRVDSLQPPRMELGTRSANSSTTSLVSVPSRNQGHINSMLAKPGGQYVSHPPTALSKLQATDTSRESSLRPTLDGKRHWSITDNDGDILIRKAKPQIVTQADIARVQALFLCSGIKAKEINQRAQRTQLSPPEFLRRAAETTQTKLVPVPRREEHVLAARILVKDLEVSTRSLQSSLESFRDKAIKDLTCRISNLQTMADPGLMTSILDSSDQALRITSEISGQGPLQVKQITDEIDRMLRARRRQTRWLRGFGWMMVEWMLVAIMWCVWLVVVLVGSVKKVFGVGWGVVKWLLWL